MMTVKTHFSQIFKPKLSHPIFVMFCFSGNVSRQGFQKLLYYAVFHYHFKSSPIKCEILPS